MTEYFKLKKANCKNCHKCIRHCPVKAIRFSDGQAQIVQSDCILCGECFITCPQNAKSIRSDLQQAKELLAAGEVWVSLAPSVLANYEGASIRSIDQTLRKLGFAGAEETALGATMVKRRYDEMVEQGELDVIISSCCHSVNTLIQKHYPAALPYLAKVASPMMAHCSDLKERHPGAKTVFIGPCVSKKAEAEQYPGPVDCVLTFEELSGWLEEEGLAIPVDPEQVSGTARLFPISGGILRTMECNRKDYSYMVVDGTTQCIEALGEVIQGRLTHCFIEMSACRGGCVGGPAMHTRTVMHHTSRISRVAGPKDFQVFDPGAEKLHKEMPPLPSFLPRPGNKAIEEVLRKMGKTLPEHELNCGTCGYDTCRDKAVAILTGKAEIEMCLPYLMEKAQSFSDSIINNTPNGIIVVNELTEIQQINPSACRLLNIKHRQDVLNRQLVCVLDPTPFLDVQFSKKTLLEKHQYLAEYDRYITITIVRDSASGLLIGILRDITEEEKAHNSQEELSRKTIEITDQVIQKQMRTVQEIASLLGETTAETKVALTKLKETLRNE